MGLEVAASSFVMSVSRPLRTPYLIGIIFLVVAWAPGPSLQNHYCSISKDHTLCKFQGVGPRCKNAFDIGIPSSDRKQILHLHNHLRQMVATGGERRGRPGPQPSGGNVRQMEWDDELAMSAQRLAEQCKYTHDCLNCRKVDRFLTGQNLYQFSENLLRDGSNWEQAIMAWYDEVARFSPRSVDYFEFIKELGHYTQMLWADTYKMGCGYAYYKDGKWNRKLYVCNYGPAGNIITTEMYKRGAPCSACPEGTFCSQQYPGLCTSSSAAVAPTPSVHHTTRHHISTTALIPYQPFQLQQHHLQVPVVVAPQQTHFIQRAIPLVHHVSHPVIQHHPNLIKPQAQYHHQVVHHYGNGDEGGNGNDNSQQITHHQPVLLQQHHVTIPTVTYHHQQHYVSQTAHRLQTHHPILQLHHAPTTISHHAPSHNFVSTSGHLIHHSSSFGNQFVYHH